MNKKLIALCAMALSLLMFGAIASAATPTGKTLLERAKNAYSPARTYTVLHINQGKTEKEFKYKAAYVPIKDLFDTRVSGIKWDNKTKIAEVTSAGKTLVFNFSNQKLESSDTKIVLPKEWIRMSQGRTEINSSVVAYLFDKYSASYKDKERDEWEEKLSFLGIKESEAVPGVKDSYLYVYVTFEEKSS
ncbi:stalk domain-containing protein [Cohnella thermotolerans]|uniref:stalk domain-containing protein n=1 Tax=Cohnella thermotolerans TaxID=329858 RepID=UPI0004793D9F|nr:stalk domain-containing protein [Cohnella thermotolerans]